MKNRLIVALDVPSRQEALHLVDILRDEVGCFKIGMQLYNSEGPDIVRDIQTLGGDVFVDLKFHDIPNTVAQTTKIITQRQAYMFSLHASGGQKMMEACAQACRETAFEYNVRKPLALAVTVLTSISQEMFEEEIGIKRPIADQVVYWAQMAQKAGIDGVVASPHEITRIRQAVGKEFAIVTPGVRPLWASTNDQARIMTPKEAIECGASHLVVGRPITQHRDPKTAVRMIVEEMEAARV